MKCSQLFQYDIHLQPVLTCLLAVQSHRVEGYQMIEACNGLSDWHEVWLRKYGSHQAMLVVYRFAQSLFSEFYDSYWSWVSIRCDEAIGSNGVSGWCKRHCPLHEPWLNGIRGRYSLRRRYVSAVFQDDRRLTCNTISYLKIVMVFSARFIFLRKRLTTHNVSL